MYTNKTPQTKQGGGLEDECAPIPGEKKKNLSTLLENLYSVVQCGAVCFIIIFECLFPDLFTNFWLVKRKFVFSIIIECLLADLFTNFLSQAKSL